MKSYSSFFAGVLGFRDSESARLLRLANEQQPPTLPVDELLARHLELVRSGAALPAWASNWIPHSTGRPREGRPGNRYDPIVAEMREVAQAERLLASDPARALSVTRRVQARFEAAYFAEERIYVEVMALHRLGRSGELRERAAAFLHTYPDGLYTAPVRTALASTSARN